MRIMSGIRCAPIVLERYEYPDTFVHIADSIGNNEACSLLWNLPAFQIRHIPTKYAMFLKVSTIKRDFDGSNAATLSGQLGIRYNKIKHLYNNECIKPDISANLCMKIVAENCGNIVAEKLLEHFPGQAIHIPSSGKRKIIRKLINLEFTGNNHLTLAAKYGFSIQFIYRVLQEKHNKRFEQLSLFEKSG